jgi:hypothetical protein
VNNFIKLIEYAMRSILLSRKIKLSVLF